MIKKLILGAGVAITVFALGSAGALAYTGSAGASATTSSTTAVPGGTVTLTATFMAPGTPGNAVSFSAAGGGTGCTVNFSPASGTTNSSSNITTTVTFGANCSGTVNLTATDTSSGQFVTTGVTVTGGLPNASAEKAATQNLPIAPIAALIASLALIAFAGGMLIRRRS